VGGVGGGNSTWQGSRRTRRNQPSQKAARRSDSTIPCFELAPDGLVLSITPTRRSRFGAVGGSGSSTELYRPGARAKLMFLQGAATPGQYGDNFFRARGWNVARGAGVKGASASHRPSRGAAAAHTGRRLGVCESRGRCGAMKKPCPVLSFFSWVFDKPAYPLHAQLDSYRAIQRHQRARGLRRPPLISFAHVGHRNYSVVAFPFLSAARVRRGGGGGGGGRVRVGRGGRSAAGPRSVAALPGPPSAAKPEPTAPHGAGRHRIPKTWQAPLRTPVKRSGSTPPTDGAIAPRAVRWGQGDGRRGTGKGQGSGWRGTGNWVPGGFTGPTPARGLFGWQMPSIFSPPRQVGRFMGNLPAACWEKARGPHGGPASGLRADGRVTKIESERLLSWIRGSARVHRNGYGWATCSIRPNRDDAPVELHRGLVVYP